MCVDWCHAHTSHNRYISRLCAVSVRARFFMNHLMHDSMDTIHALNQFIYYFIRGNWFIYCQFTLDSFTHARGQTNKLAHTLASTVEFITQWAIQVCCLLHNKSAVDDAICAARCLSFFLYLKKTNYRRFSFPSLHPIGQTTMMHNAENIRILFVCLFHFGQFAKVHCVVFCSCKMYIVIWQFVHWHRYLHITVENCNRCQFTVCSQWTLFTIPAKPLSLSHLIIAFLLSFSLCLWFTILFLQYLLLQS